MPVSYGALRITLRCVGMRQLLLDQVIFDRTKLYRCALDLGHQRSDNSDFACD